MYPQNRLRIGAVLLLGMAIAFAFTAPADARRRGRIHIPIRHHHHFDDSSTNGSSTESHSNPWAKDPPADESPIDGSTIVLMVGIAIALGGGWLFLRVLVAKAQENPDPPVLQTTHGNPGQRAVPMNMPRAGGFGTKLR